MNYQALAARRALVVCGQSRRRVAAGHVGVSALGGAMLRQSSTILPIRANRPGLHEFTPQVRRFVEETGIGEGLLTIFCRHTSASLLIQESAAPAARRDLEAYFARLAPEGGAYEH